MHLALNSEQNDSSAHIPSSVSSYRVYQFTLREGESTAKGSRFTEKLINGNRMSNSSYKFLIKFI